MYNVEEDFLKGMNFLSIADEYGEAKKEGRDYDAVVLVDIIKFSESKEWGNLKLYPAQSLFFKIAYKLWDDYPFTDEELVLAAIENEKWDIDLLSRCHDKVINHFMLIVGRRGLKSSTIALIIAYESYRLILKGDPQKYYNLLPGTEIYITNCASSEDQSKTVYNLAYERIKDMKFFRNYLDNSLDNSTEIALYSMKDLEVNNEIARNNDKIPRGEAYRKEKRRNGTIRIKSIPTSASGARSRGAIVVIFDEFAHFERPKSKGKGDPRELLGGNKRTDEAMYRALSPSAATYGKDYKVFVITSPADSSGKCYQLYTSWRMRETHYVQQFATWEVNPTVPENHPEVIETKREDPIGYRMEWAGEFVESITKIFTDNALNTMINSTRVYSESPGLGIAYIITLDPAKGSDVNSDTYAVSWGHAEKVGEHDYIYVIDGMKGFRPEIVPDPETGEFMVQPLDPLIVDEFILRLSGSLKRVVGVFYDQYNSTSSISKFRKVHLPAVETTYTTKYKREMYSNFIKLVNAGKVETFGCGDLGDQGSFEIEMYKTELSHLQRVLSGNSVTFKHPESGPVTTDDFADVAANLVYQLDRYSQLGMAYLKDLSKAAHSAIHFGTEYKPILTGGVNARKGGARNRALKVANIANRARTHKR